MEIQTIKIPYTGKNTSFSIEPIPDWHIGVPYLDHEKEEKVLKRIHDDPNRFTIIMGDVADNIFPRGSHQERRFHMKQWDKTYDRPSKAYKYAFQHLAPIKDKILGIHVGNHDDDLMRWTFEDEIENLCENLNVKYLGYVAMTRLVFVYKSKGKVKGDHQNSYDILSAHGSYFGQRVGGVINRTEDLASFFNADIYLMGHTHELASDKRIQIEIRRGHLYERPQIFGATGSFMKSYPEGGMSYAETKLYRPKRAGTLTVRIEPYNHRLSIIE